MVEGEVRQPSQANHESSDQRFEEELLQSELVSSRQVTMDDFLKMEYRDFPLVDALLYIPVNFQVRDNTDSLMYIASFPVEKITFGSYRLVEVLRRAKPVGKDGRPRSQQIGGVIGDWKIMQDKTERAGKDTNGLYEEHISPKSIITKHFKEFGANHFVAFWDAINLPQDHKITPVVVWKKDKSTGKREYFCGRIWDPLIHAFPEMFSSWHDTLLGQIVVAGYSDELRRILPTRLPLVKGGPKQNMLEPQMPVFVPLFARAYLNMSPVIAGFEGLGDK